MRPWLVLMLLTYVADGYAQAPPGLAVSAPDTLAGRWEASDGHGGAIGMNVTITTSINGAVSSIAEHSQYLTGLIVALYQRDKGKEAIQFNYFSSAHGGMTWDGHRIHISSPGDAQLPAVNVDLVWHGESQAWRGSFDLDLFRGEALLERPHPSASVSPFVGTWVDRRELMNNCLHIAEQQDGIFIAWADDLETPGRMNYANGIQPPSQTFEHYGEIAKAKVVAAGQIRVELRSETPICCAHPFEAKISSDGRALTGVWLPGGNQVSMPLQWEKMPSVSCIDAYSAVPH